MVVVRRLRSLASERPWPFYPLLVGAYFVFFLYSVNLDEAELGDVLPVLTVVLLAILVLLLGFGLLVGSVRRVALVLTAAVAAFLAYGHVASLLAPYRLSFGLQQIAWAAAVVLAGVVAWQIRDWLVPVTRGLNLLAGVLVLVTLLAIVPHQIGLMTADQGASATAEGASPPPTLAGDEPIASGDLPDGKLPDIVYLIWDRYPGPHSAKLGFDIDNTVYDELRDRGFFIADRSHANYQRTSMSVSSTLSAEMLNGRGHSDEVFGKTDMSGNYTRIQNSNVAQFLKERGYYYVHIGSDFSGTRPGTLADVNRSFDQLSDFADAFIQSTALPAVQRRIGVAGGARWDRRHEWTTWELDVLENLPEYPSPSFVFGHVLLPHTPYIFDADGSYIRNPESSKRSHREQFAAQLEYTNRRLLAIIDHLLDRPVEERPIIIIQGDEGPYPDGLEDQTRYDWTEATPEEREVKFNILNSWYIPDGRDIGLYPGISSVNTFRLLFNEYFGTDLPLLPDESFTRSHPEPLEFPSPERSPAP